MTQFVQTPSDATQFDATPEYMHDVAGNVAGAAETIGGQLHALLRYCRGFEGLWEGVAQLAFQELMTGFKTNADLLNDALVNISKELDLNAAKYEEGEHVNHLQISNIVDSIPSVNL